MEKIEMATVSSRGQICIPNGIRDDMGLKEGSKVLFVLTDDSLIMKKVNGSSLVKSWSFISKEYFGEEAFDQKAIEQLKIARDQAIKAYDERKKPGLKLAGAYFRHNNCSYFGRNIS